MHHCAPQTAGAARHYVSVVLAITKPLAVVGVLDVAGMELEDSTTQAPKESWYSSKLEQRFLC